jgi:acylphosphatase
VSRVHLRIHGHVQGVFFRQQARQRAQGLGLAGWVRNCSDGTVEAEAQGAEEAVRQFVSWAHRGPPSAQVTRVEADRLVDDPDLHTFRVIGW